MNEATARIKINKQLELAGWRFFPEGDKPANIRLELSVRIWQSDLDDLGDDFEKTKKGVVDFLLLDSKGFPLLVLEAKSENKNPLTGKEQARKYALSQKCRFVILSNGNLHYLWDLERGNPHIITSFPTPESVTGYAQVQPDPERLIREQVDADYIVLTQRPNYASEAAWKNEAEREDYKRANSLRFLRDYQLKAVHTLQQAVKDGADRFLFEMATGTGKTLTAAAVIKLFLNSQNASRVLFLVDRLELEEQARKVFQRLLSADAQTVVYKKNRSDWQRADIVVTTVQSLQFNNKYQSLFSPTDFDLVISDEAHRSISGNARAVFDYFVGYKLGLTATPRDYLKGVDLMDPLARDPRDVERRLLRDTYRTFGCESGEPTFRYSLLDGVRDGYLVNPTVVDARTHVTTQLLAEDGFVVTYTDNAGDDHEEAFKQREFERRFFSEATNKVLCKTFLENALRDPVSGEIGKSIVFAVSQNHAAKLTQLLNEMADMMYPDKYQSDFAVQVSSHVADAQQFTINFANNKLMGSENFIPSYKTSRARVCVTVGMMTTGYDCTDILNLGLFRPIFSPTDFVQIKGRGTRQHDFRDDLFDDDLKEEVIEPDKTTFKLFDFFATCEYFETEFNYDQVIKLPTPPTLNGGGNGRGRVKRGGAYEHLGTDILKTISAEPVGAEGMKIDRMLFGRFEEVVLQDETVAQAVEAEQWEVAEDHVIRNIFDQPGDRYTLDRLRKAANVDRPLTTREVLEKAFGLIPRFKSKDELLEEEFAKFMVDYRPSKASSVIPIKNLFKAYATNGSVRAAIDESKSGNLATNPVFSSHDLSQVPETFRRLVPEYIRDYLSLKRFTS
ncbi:MAG: DEAD/DEAH box helicase family protein [Chloroflexi bacterium]|nr:DEAD/DEAH box helicase family protein [Chloroflexota bacterium]